MVAPRSGTVLVEGRRLHYLEWGDRSAAPVVILHGFSGHAWQAQHPARALGATHWVLALDQRGHGDSDPAEIYGAKPMVADLIAFLDTLGIAQVALVGHSLGGIVALCATALYPKRVTRLVLGDIGPEIASEGVERIQRNVRERDVFESVDDAYEQQLALNPTADPTALRERVEHNLRPCPDGTLTWKYDRALRDGTARYDNFTGDEQWAFWRAITVPVLVLRGEISDILTPDIADRMLAANSRARLVTIPDAGHSIATDAPDRVTAALVEFL
jgi:pimeloyl-ACP methyl ester carboxylesterase